MVKLGIPKFRKSRFVGLDATGSGKSRILQNGPLFLVHGQLTPTKTCELSLSQHDENRLASDSIPIPPGFQPAGFDETVHFLSTWIPDEKWLSFFVINGLTDTAVTFAYVYREVIS